MINPERAAILARGLARDHVDDLDAVLDAVANREQFVYDYLDAIGSHLGELKAGWTRAGIARTIAA